MNRRVLYGCVFTFFLYLCQPTAVTAATLEVNPGTLFFGNTGLNSPASSSLTLKAVGGPVSVSDILITGNDFSAKPGGTAPCSSLKPSLAQDSECTLQVTFAPADLGVKDAVFTIKSDVADVNIPLQGIAENPTLSLALVGTGVGSLTFTYQVPNGVQYTSPSYNSYVTTKYPVGTIISITPAAGQDSKFSGWQGCPKVLNGKCSFTLSKDTNVIVRFTDSTPVQELIRLEKPAVFQSKYDWVNLSVAPDAVIVTDDSNPARPVRFNRPAGSSSIDFSNYSTGGFWITSGLTALTIDKDDSKLVYASTQTALYDSTDGGINFSVPNIIGSAREIVIDPNDHTLVYAATNNGIYKKIPSGWEIVETIGITGSRFKTMTIDNEGTLYVAPEGNWLWRHENGIWSLLPIPATVPSTTTVVSISISSTNPELIYIVTNPGGISDGTSFVSTDRGVSWTKLPQTYIKFLFNPLDSETVYALNKYSIYKSINHGANWDNIVNQPTPNLYLGKDVEIIPDTVPPQFYALGDTDNSYAGRQYLYTSESLGLKVTPGSYNFGSVDIHTAQSHFLVTVTNNGLSPVNLTTLSLLGANSDQFMVEIDSTSGNTPCQSLNQNSLPAGNSCTVKIVFNPNTVGRKVASFSVVGNPYQHIGVTLNGLATATPPAGTINIQGKPTVTTRNITVSLSGTDANTPTERLKFRTSLDGRNWSTWELFAATKDLVLPPGNGTKSVYVQYLNEAGGVSMVASDTVSLAGICNVSMRSVCYASINEALPLSQNSDTLYAKSISFSEAVTINQNLSLLGGYGANFEPPFNGSQSSISSLTIAAGSLIVDSFTIY